MPRSAHAVFLHCKKHMAVLGVKARTSLTVWSGCAAASRGRSWSLRALKVGRFACPGAVPERMSETATDQRPPEMLPPESDFAGRSLRLQTLIRLRWLAVGG